MNQQFGLWLYPLLVFAVIALVVRARVKWSWAWSFQVQALAVVLVAILGLTVGPDWICAGVGWAMAITFFVIPRIFVTRIENCIALLDAAGAMRNADTLQYFYWGKSGRFWQDMAKAYGFFIKGDAQSAEAILSHWQGQPDTPKELIELIGSYRLTGHVILWDWQGIIAEFEQLQLRLNAKVSSGLYLSASRAYAELGRIEEATQCLEKANIVESRVGTKNLALSLLPFMCLSGGLRKVNELRALITAKGRETLPEYSEYYWLGRCLSARGDIPGARESYETALVAAEKSPTNAPAWAKRIKYQLDNVDARPVQPDWSAQIARVWRLFQQNQFVQEIVNPRRKSPVVALLAIAIFASFIVCNVYRVFDSQANQKLAFDCFNMGVLDPKKTLAGEYWRLLTYLFLHRDLTHLFLNVLGLYWFGRIAQNIFGTTRFLAIYFVAGILSGIAHSILQPELPAVGASGAVMGIFGAVAAGIYRLKKEIPDSIRRTELMWMGGLAMSQIVIDRLIPHVAAFAHLGGVLAGVFFGLIVAVPRPSYEQPEPAPAEPGAPVTN